jgi:hypothetical protein
VSANPLTLSALLAIPLELYSSDFHLTLYCDNIIGTVPVLRQFALLAVAQTLVRHQVIEDYLIWQYPV